MDIESHNDPENVYTRICMHEQFWRGSCKKWWFNLFSGFMLL